VRAGTRAQPLDLRSELDDLRAGLKAREHKRVLDRSELLLESYSQHAGLLSIAASAAYSLGRLEEARRYLERALIVQPDSQALKDSLARVKRKMEQG
jgi:tetratricopeptide (TPR) repeat protein